MNITQEKLKSTIGIIVTTLFLLALYWGLWKGAVWIYDHIDTSDFWTRRIVIALFSVGAASLTFFLTKFIRERFELKRLSVFLEVLKLEIDDNKNNTESHFPSAIETEDLKPFIKYVEPVQYMSLFRVVYTLNAVAKVTIEEGRNEIVVKSTFLSESKTLIKEVQVKLKDRA